jgi:dihydroflavonol-4-reductase
MKVLVTGASGFVGSWLVRRLIREGLQVRTLRRKSSSAPPSTDQDIAWGDITDPASVLAATQDVDTVFHLAGHVGYSRAERALMQAINVEGTRHVVAACRRNRVRRLVHMSSVVAVGASFDGRRLLNEDDPFNLHHLNLGYFETKLAAEKIVQAAVANGEIDAVMLNPSTIYGAGDAAKGSRKVQLKVAQGRFSFYTGGGVSIVGVEEVVDAVVTAWHKGRSGHRYILSGENITIHQLFTLIAEQAQAIPPKIYLPDLMVRGIGRAGNLLERMGRKGPLNSESAWTSILYHWFDNQKARTELGFKPQSARDAIAKSVNWIREQGWLSPHEK